MNWSLLLVDWKKRIGADVEDRTLIASVPLRPEWSEQHPPHRRVIEAIFVVAFRRIRTPLIAHLSQLLKAIHRSPDNWPVLLSNHQCQFISQRGFPGGINAGDGNPQWM